MNLSEEYMKMLALRDLGGEFEMYRESDGFVRYRAILPPDQPEPIPTASAAQILGTEPSVKEGGDMPESMKRFGKMLENAGNIYDTIGEKTGQDVFDFVMENTGNRGVAEMAKKRITDRINASKFVAELFVPQSPEDVALMAAFAGPLPKMIKRGAAAVGGFLMGSEPSETNEAEAAQEDKQKPKANGE